MTTTPTERAAALLAELGITIVPPGRRRSAVHGLETCAAQTLELLIERHGEGHARFVLRTIIETTRDNATELTRPTIGAVSEIALAHPEWTEHGWLEAFELLPVWWTPG